MNPATKAAAARSDHGAAKTYMQNPFSVMTEQENQVVGGRTSKQGLQRQPGSDIEPGDIVRGQ